MADYSIQLGVKVDTKGIDTAINKYQGKPIEVKSKLDTSGIDKKIASYKVKKPIEINTKLNTSGLAKKIGEYKPKTPIKLNAKLDTNDISTTLRNYKAKTPIKVDIKLDSSDISKQIKAYKAKTPIKVDIKLDSNDITKQIRSYQAKAPIKLNVKLTTKDIDEKIRAYKAKTPIKLDVKINNSAINEQIKSFNPKTTIKLKAALQKGAIADEIRKFKPSAPIKVDLELNYSDIDKKVGEYAAKGGVALPAKLIPASKGFDSGITKKPIEVSATLEPSDINKVIDGFKPTSKVKVDVQLVPKDINTQVTKLQKPTEPLTVDIKLDESSINSSIELFKPTATLGVKPDLILEDVDDQIRAYVPKSKVKVNIELNDIAADAGKQNAQPPITVNAKLDRDDINTQIKNFKTNSKIKVGVKLDFASHKDDAGNEIQKGISKQIKDYNGKTKIKVGVEIDKDSVNQEVQNTQVSTPIRLGVELDRNSINQEVQNIQATTPIRLGVELDTAGVQNVNNQLDNIRQQIQQLGNITINFGGNPRNRGIGNVTSAFERATREVYNLYKQIESMELKLGKLEMSGIDAGNITTYRHQLDGLRQTYENLLATMSGQNGAINLDVVFTDIDRARTLITELSSSVDNARTKLAKDIKIDINNGKLQGEIDSVIQKFNQLGVVNQGVTDSVEELQRMLTNMRVSDNIESVTSDYQEFLQLLKTVKNAVNDLEREINEANRPEVLSTAREAAMHRLNGLFERGSQAAKVFGERAEELRNELNMAGSTKGIDLVSQKIQNLGTEVKNSGLQVKTFSSRLKEQFYKYANYLSIASVFTEAIQAARSMFEQVKLIDAAMTELKKVTDETDATYDNFLNNAASRAKEIGTTIDGLIESTADFARLGYDFADAQGLAEVANIYAVVGDEIEGVEGATESLISTMAAFKGETSGMNNTDFAMSIIDRFNEIGNNFSISSGGIGEALERSASSLMAANNTIDESIALITAANSVVQSPEQVGNAFKTISMRIRGAKTELEDAGLETEGMVESTAKLRSEILALSGVDIMENATEFKSTYKIMDELAAKWKDLSDIQQATVTELIAGKRQGNIVSSLMENFDTARDALETSMNSAGSAMREHEKWQQSLESRILSLKSSWQGLSQAFLSSDFLKTCLDGVINLADGFTKLIDTFGAFPTLMGTLTTGMSVFKNTGFFSVLNKDVIGAQKQLSLLGKSFKDISRDMSSGQGLFKSLFSKSITKTDVGYITEYFKQVKSGVPVGQAYANTLSHASVAGKQMAVNIKKGTASMSGLKTATTGGKLALFGLEVAATAANAALTMGLSIAIQLVVEWISKLINAKDDLAEKVDEITSKFKEQHQELAKLKGDYDTSNESSMISRYAKLSKGVDGLGRNVSLTAEEYSEYQDIVSTIADQIPSLVSGYDSQGNAILGCAGNVDQLTAAYEKLIKAQNDEVLVNSAGDINKDFKNALKDAEHDTAGFFGWNWTKELGWGDSKLSMQSAEIYENILNSKDAIEEFNKAISTGNANDLESFLDNSDVDAMSELLEAAGFEKEGDFWSGKESNAEHIRRALEEDKSKVKDIIDQYYADLEEEAEAKKAQAQAALSNAFDLSDSMYYGMSDTMKNIAQQTVGAFDFKFFADLEKQGISVKKYVNNMLDQLNAINDSDEASIEAAFNLKTQFNSGDISYGEYVNGLENAGKLIDRLGLNKELTSQIKLSLGLDEKGLVENYQTLLNRLTETSDKKIASGNIIGLDLSEAESLLDSLSSEELSVMTQILPDIDANATREQIEAAINREMVLQGLTFDLNLEVEAAGIESLNTALSESVTASGLSSDSISALKSRYADLESQGYDLSSMFEETSHGIHLNRNELSKFENELSKQKLAEVDADLNEMKSAYDELGEAIKNCDDPLKKSELYNERQSLAQKISECATLASQYKGLTSAYNDWLAAESAGNERDMYENVITGFETVKDELSRGWADDGTIKFLEMLTGRTDLASKSGKELKEVYDGLGKKIKDTTYSVKDFFTVDDDGNSTSKGVYNFLDAVGQLEEEAFGGKDIVKRDGKGNVIGFDFELAGGDEVIAEALGVSEELVQIMVRAADDAGFVVSMDGTYRQLADLQNEAKAAANYLKEIGKTDFDFDFNTSSVSKLKDQLKEAKEILKDKSFWNADGTFNFDANGATEAMQIVSTLQAKIDTLTKEQYGIGLTVEDKEFEEPLENLQNYGKKVAALNQLELNPKANAEEIEKLNGELDDISEYFATLDTDTKVKLGFEAGDGIEEVKSKIESGEVKVPTTLDIQTNMDKNLSDLRDLALLNSGYLSEEQENAIKIRLGIEVEGGEIDDSKLQEDIKNGVHDNSAYWSENKPKVEVESEVEIKPASEVTISDSFEGDVKTGAEGRLNGMGVDVDAEVNVDAKVDTSKAEEKTKEKTKEAVENQNGETATVEKDVKLEFNISNYTDELSKFKDVAKELDSLEDVSLTVNANFEGNVLGASGDLNKIKTFAEGAKELQGAESSYVTVSANLEGNVTDKDKLENLKTFAEGAKELDGAKSSYITVEANLKGNIDSVKNIDNIKSFAEGAKELKDVESAYINVDANLNGNIKDLDNLENIKTFAEGAKELKDVESVSVNVTAEISGSVLDSTSEKLENLKAFAKGAKELKGVENSNVTITANFEGTLKDASNIENLATFVQNAKDLKDVKSSEVTITANVSGNALDSDASKLDNIKIFAEGAKELQGVKEVNTSVTANANGNALDSTDDKLDNLKTFAEGAKALQGVKAVDVSVTANINGNISSTSANTINDIKTFADGAKELQGTKSSDVSVNANISGNLASWTGSLGDLAQFASNAKALEGTKSSDVSVNANINGNISNESVSMLGHFASVVNTLSTKQVNIGVKASIDTASINTAMDLLTKVANSGLFKDYNAVVTATVNYNKGEQTKPEDMAANVNYNLGTQADPKDKNATVNYVLGSQDAPKSKTVYVNYVGLGPAAGTAYASGTTGRAFARGDWGIKGNGIALGGELGRRYCDYT